MRYYTHITTSLAATVAVSSQTDMNLSAGLLVGVIIGSLLPDIDEPKSKIGRKAPGISHATKLVFGHRGFTHTLIATVLVGWLLFYFTTSVPFGIAQGITIGYLFHILGDSFSKSGVPLFMPFTKKHFGIPLYRTGSIIEHLIFLLSIVALGYLIPTIDFAQLI